MAPPPFVPGRCTLRSLDAAAQCASTCPVELAGELDCAGASYMPSELLADEQYLYAALSFNVAHDRRTVVALRIDPRAATFAWHEFAGAHKGLWWRDGDAKQLLAVDRARITAYSIDAAFERFSPGTSLPVSSPPWDAYYDASGALHVWSERAMPPALLLDNRVVAEAPAGYATALLDDGTSALAYLLPDQDGVGLPACGLTRRVTASCATWRGRAGPSPCATSRCDRRRRDRARTRNIQLEHRRHGADGAGAGVDAAVLGGGVSRSRAVGG